METNQKKARIEEYLLHDNGIFPNSRLPVLLYKSALQIPFLFPAAFARKRFAANNWKNSWKAGVFTYHHYHSVTHEVLAIIKGKTTLQLGGDSGFKLEVEKGDVLIIPAGVAHKNLGRENNITVVGAYPDGNDYDMNYGKKGERPGTDKNISNVPLPGTDPLYGANGILFNYWKKL